MYTQDDTGISILGPHSSDYARLLHAALPFNEEGCKRYLAIWKSAITRTSERPEDLLLSTMGIFGIDIAEGEQRSRKSVFSAFVRELRKEGFKGDKIVAFSDAVAQTESRAPSTISDQWRKLIQDIYQAFPMLQGGKVPLPVSGFLPEKTGEWICQTTGPDR